MLGDETPATSCQYHPQARQKRSLWQAWQSDWCCEGYDEVHREQLLLQQLAVHTAELTKLLVVVEHLAPVQLAVVQLAAVQPVPERRQRRPHAVHSAFCAMQVRLCDTSQGQIVSLCGSDII